MTPFRYSKGLNHHLDYSGDEEEREEVEVCHQCEQEADTLIAGLCRSCREEEESVDEEE